MELTFPDHVHHFRTPSTPSCCVERSQIHRSLTIVLLLVVLFNIIIPDTYSAVIPAQTALLFFEFIYCFRINILIDINYTGGS